MDHGCSIVHRRQRSRTLAPLIMPMPIFPVNALRGGDDDDPIEGGKELFTNFVHGEIVKEGLACSQTLSDICTPIGYNNPLWAKAGRELRWMADAFAKTEERKKIRKRAMEVGITEVSFQQFYDLLKELFFEGGFTKERIMVLFFFCTDVAVRSLRQGAELFKRFLQWSLTFITDNVCSWVQQQGGWGRVFGDCGTIPASYIVIGAAFAVTAYYGWRHFSRC
ncbi:uncharacterized protein LOC121386736 [Gigantopelta aegis]|uniref:uncharacterized protein LOC121386736 n=1 Tax=Gigantopelta aegis TaxID=1735272 RepID=UPI001B88E709|nr:uncharacterized protein LOC121386736 [Gigantopelta aegis]